MGNITKAILCKTRVCRTAPLYQYDYGQILQIVGPELPSAYEVHYSNQPHGTATTQIGGDDGVVIPDAYLQTGSPVYAWLYLHTGENDGETEYSITIPVIARARPTNETPSPVQQDAITEAIAALNSGVERAEAAADSAEEAVAGVQETVDAALEAAKESGEFDGVSPTVDVALITGGHRITITDADGSHIVDVMDGTDGRGVVSIEKTGTSGLVDTYTITYTDNTTATFTVTNGADGSPGASAYVWIRYAATEPTQDSDMKTTPDAWMGIYSGDSATAPTAYTAYTWYNIKGQTGPVQDVQVNGVSVLQDGVANVPVAQNGELGVVKVQRYGYNGISVQSDGEIRTVLASDNSIKDGNSSYGLIGPAKQSMAVFYGLAKAAGDTTQSASSNAVGQYTDSAKSAIHTMFNGAISVSGSTPSITALPGIQYVCGEVSTLDITTPASGIVDVVFESGSTPTVMTVTPPSGMTMKWIGEDPANLEANKTYEVNVMDGCYGMVVSWT